MPTALLLENVHPVAVHAFEAAGWEVRTTRGALDGTELVTALEGVDVLGVRSKTAVTAEVLRSAPRLLAVGAFGIGVEHVDLSAASTAGVAVFNAPFSNTRSVVELAVGEIIALTRRLTEKDTALHAGVWDKSATGAHEIRRRTLGIVGYGNIGGQLSVVAEALGMRVVFFDTVDKLALGNARRCATLDELLESADVVSLHVDGRSGNVGLFGEPQLRRMRRGSVLINLSRGFVVDHEALRDHVVSGHLAGVAVDVFPDEPKAQGEPFTSVLRGLPNVILTPHVGGSTEEAQEGIGHFVAGKLLDFHAAGATTLSVNLPTVELSHGPGSSRLAYLHRNVPGVLAQVNGVLARHGVNVEGQALTTRGELGYLLTEIGGDCEPQVVDELARLPETVRLRALSCEGAVRGAPR